MMSYFPHSHKLLTSCFVLDKLSINYRLLSSHLMMLYDFQYSFFAYGFASWKVYARKEALKGGLDKTVSLQKDLSEMHEWMTQAEEEYLERDFEYKTPDELQKAVEEMKVK